MKVIKINFSDEQYERLREMAETQGISIQDMIRLQFFNNHTIFTPEEAVRRIEAGAVDGMDRFTLPSIYGEEWTLNKGQAGPFGKAFYNYITLRPELGIRYIEHGSDGKRAEYRKVN